ncbi:MAG: hypothetical protein JWP27_237 [Flaviaesturariibacter sp.]|nr:hypothetical protein [Flaviaesturariibacter sp.]
MRRLSVVLLVMTWSCGRSDNVPSDVLPQERMGSVMWDIIRADEVANHQYPVDSNGRRFRRSTELYRSIFQLHGITDSQFKKSFRYYENHPQLLKPVLDSLDARARQPVPPVSPKPAV